MNFFSNKIVNPAGKGLSWDEYLSKVLNKTASEAKPESEGDPRGQGRGQVINNDNEEGAHSYQEGESVTGKKDQAEGFKKSEATETKQADCGKCMGDSPNAGKVTEDHADAASAEKGDAACSQKINDDPNYQKGESVSPSKVDGKNKKEETKAAESAKTVKSSNNSKFRKVASMNRKEKLELFAHMTSQKSKSGSAAWPIEYVEAMVGQKFANLKDDEKAWFKKFWLTMFPESYVDELVADR